MCVIGRSESSLSGTSVSRSSTGTRPTWATQTAGVELPTRQLDAHDQRLAQPVQRAHDRQPVELVVRVGVLLVAVGVDRLAEVPLAVHQAHADQGERHVRGGLHVVAGEDAQAARVDAQGLVEAVLGAEVGDRAVQVRGVALLEPVALAVRHVGVELAEDGLVFRHERRVVEELAPGDRPGQDGDRVAVAGPGAGVDAGEQGPGARMPAPPQVVRQPAQALEPWRQVERGAGRDRNGDEGFHEPEMIDGIGQFREPV